MRIIGVHLLRHTTRAPSPGVALRRRSILARGMKNKTLFAIQPALRAPITWCVATKHMSCCRSHEHERRAAAVTLRMKLLAAEAMAGGAVQKAQAAEVDPFHQTCSKNT